MEYESLEVDGLIFAGRVARMTGERADLARDQQRGLLLGIRRGVYVRRELWNTKTERERHIIRVRATVAAADQPVVVTGVSAAAVWGIPIAGSWPEDVMLLQDRPGGGRREPGVRRTSVGVATARPVLLGGIPVTTLARTALDIARTNTFSVAVGSVDWVLWRKNPGAISRDELAEEAEILRPVRGFRRIARVTEFATTLSDSFGESRARAVIHLLGFQSPVLQQQFHDSDGDIFPDFFWKSASVAAEFDGKQKYTRDEYTCGDPSEVVWREKQREDRLRRQVGRVERILNWDVMQPGRLERILTDANVPRYHLAGGEKATGRGYNAAHRGISPPASG
jgi:hypothetical protein